MTLQFHKRHLYLQRGVGEETYEVGLGGDLQRHEVKDDDAQRTDVLGMRAGVVHNEDVLLLEKIYCG